MWLRETLFHRFPRFQVPAWKCKDRMLECGAWGKVYESAYEANQALCSSIISRPLREILTGRKCMVGITSVIHRENLFPCALV